MSSLSSAEMAYFNSGVGSSEAEGRAITRARGEALLVRQERSVAIARPPEAGYGASATCACPAQWRKCLTPVKTIAMLCFLSQVSIAC